MLALKIAIIKKLIIAMTALVSLLSSQEPKLGAIQTGEGVKLEEVKTEQNNNYFLYGEYKRFEKTADIDGVQYKFTSGQWGDDYQVIIEKDEAGLISRKRIGYGKQSFIDDWTTFQDKRASSTP